VGASDLSLQKQLVRIAAPLVFGSILQQLYNAADTLIIGRYLGTDAYAAAGIGGTVVNLFIFILTGCATGASVILSQQYGGGDMADFRRESGIAAVCGLSFAAFLSLSGCLLLAPCLTLLQTPAPLFPYTVSYLRVILLALPLTYLYNLCAACLRAVGDTGAALWVLAGSITANTILDILFVGYWNMGIAGAAWATAAAQFLSVIFCLLYMKCALPETLPRFRDFRWDRALARKTVSYGFVSALQQSSLYLGKLLVMGTVNSLGTETIRGYTAAMRLEGFINSFGDGGAAATSILIGQRYGAGDRDGVSLGFRWSMKLHLISGGVLATILFVTAKPSALFMLNGTGGPALTEAVRYLCLVSCFYLLNFIGCAFVGFYRGIGLLSAPTIGSTLHIILRVILTAVFAPRFGLAAVAVATGIGWLLAAVFHTTVYYRAARKIIWEIGN